MSDLALQYIEAREKNLSKFCSWLSRYSEQLEADEIDLKYLARASFMADGKTVVFQDGSIARKSLAYRKTPWLLVV